MKVGVAALGRPTFDVPFAEHTAARAFDALDDLGGIEVVGSRRVALDEAGLAAAVAALAGADIDVLLVIQASFADSSLVAAVATATDAPVVLWAFPEERTGGRLRLNSLCGINLAAYLLRSGRQEVRHLYADPSDPAIAARLGEALRGGGDAPDPARHSFPVTADDESAASDVAARLSDAKIGIVGDRPTGFEPCGYDEDELRAATGVTAQAVPLPALFERAAKAETEAVTEVLHGYASELPGLDGVDAAALAQSIRIHLGLADLVASNGWDAVATRCWPECFTEFGGAACAPQSRLNQELGVPGLCEADAYGAVTSLVLQWLVDAPSFVADLIHLEPADNTAVFWHCGLAPLSMADPDVAPQATVHSNRKLPLLYEFPLKPGRITIARLSQSRGRHRIVIGGGEMLRAPLPFSGTAGVARLDHPVADVLDTVIEEGLEHHYGIAYGDVRGALTALAARLDLDVVTL
ncbi:MAG TPA: hypothetical protein VLG28_09480 [Acidimicrobiia bacterium]|jgi:L-fucose isomerase-like protein|nr:hypothetical protein [Acidimicrobiia bacterium]